MINWIIWNKTVSTFKRKDMLNWTVFYLTVSQWLMFNWIVRDTWHYLEPFNFVDKTEWLLYHFCDTLYIYIYIYIHIYIYIWFGLVGFNGISTIAGYLMPNPLYTYILDIYDLVWLGFIAYQPL